MPDPRTWFKKLSLRRKRKAPEPTAYDAPPPGWMRTVPSTVNSAATALPILPLNRKQQQQQQPIPPPRRSSLASINVQPSPTDSFWLPAPTDDFWKPAQPTEQNKRLRHTVSSPFFDAHVGQDVYGGTPPRQSLNPFFGRQQPPPQHSIHITDHHQADAYNFRPIPVQSLDQFSGRQPPPLQQHSTQFTENSLAPVWETDLHQADYFFQPPPLQSLSPFLGRQQPQQQEDLIDLTDYHQTNPTVFRATPLQSHNPFLSLQHRQSTPSFPSASTPLSNPYPEHRRKPLPTIFSHPPEAKDCAICADTKPLDEFPLLCVTQECNHPPETCLECIATHIRTAVNDKVWHARVATCPQCNTPMEYNEVKEFSDPTTFAKYDKRILHDATAESNDYFCCPASGCNMSQVHEGGDDAPIVRCLGCLGKFCFRHRVVWHETMSCDEYDAFLRDPENFKSALERENERVERERQDEEKRKRDMEEADRRFAQALEEDEERRREAEAQAERERVARREQERREAEQRAVQERLAAERRARAAREAKRRADEIRASEAVVSRTTKRCPGRGCGRPIEKNDGCAHMTCLICKHNFCYDCLADYSTILKSDNSAHKRTCQWHPSNLRP